MDSTKLTNEARYKTVEERISAFDKFCKQPNCDGCPVAHSCGHSRAYASIAWLALEAVEKLEPCFYCGAEMHYRVEHRNFTDKHWLECTNNKCNFESPKYESKESAIAEHNRVASAVKSAAVHDKVKIELLNIANNGSKTTVKELVERFYTVGAAKEGENKKGE